MSAIEVVGLIIGAISGVALPWLMTRAAQWRALEGKVAEQAIEIARLQEKALATDQFHAELREIREEIRHMVKTLAAVEAAVARHPEAG